MKNFIFDLGPFSKVHCFVKVDSESKRIHILDFCGPIAVTHFMRQLQGRMLQQLGIKGKASDWKWMTYAEGEVAEYDVLLPVIESGFIQISDPQCHPDVDPDFLEKLNLLKEIHSSVKMEGVSGGQTEYM